MSERIQGYCIGKATRYLGDEIVAQPPYKASQANTLYDLLRSAMYLSRDHAELACTFATDFNPVGFVVLRVLGRTINNE